MQSTPLDSVPSVSLLYTISDQYIINHSLRTTIVNITILMVPARTTKLIGRSQTSSFYSQLQTTLRRYTSINLLCILQATNSVLLTLKNQEGTTSYCSRINKPDASQIQQRTRNCVKDYHLSTNKFAKIMSASLTTSYSSTTQKILILCGDSGVWGR